MTPRRPTEPAPARAERRRGDLRRTIRLFAEHSGGPRIFLLAMFLLVVEAGTAVLEPWPIAYLVDFLQGQRAPLRAEGIPAFLDSARIETVVVLTVALVLLAMVNSAMDSGAEILFARIGRVLGYRLRVSLYERLRNLSLAFHDQRRTGDVLTRVTGDVTVLEEFVIKSFSDLAGSILLLIGTLAFLLYKSWEAAIIAVLVVPLLAFVSNHYSRRIKSATRRQRAREGELASSAQEMLTSIRVVQSYGRGDRDQARFAEQSDQSMRAALEAATVEARFSWVVSVFQALTIAAVVWAGLWLIDNTAVTVGDLVLYILLIQNMFKPTKKIIKEWTTFGKVFASAERVAEVLARSPTVRDLPEAVPAPTLTGHLSFWNVTFSYRPDGEMATSQEGTSHDGSHDGEEPRGTTLRTVSFDVTPGQVLAIVGDSGAGKSTIAQLVPRLYDPDSGVVRIDGSDIRTFTLASLRSQIALVLQETILFSGTVAENIGYGNPDATLSDVIAAARLAGAHEFIVRLPAAYQTLLGERGANLSGGQRQRVAIARAFVRNPPILILDEPTTGLDAASTRLVVNALQTLMRGRTTLIISHNLNLIDCADRICVLEQGEIVETGTPAGLRSGGRYADLHAKQDLTAAPQRVERGTLP